MRGTVPEVTHGMKGKTIGRVIREFLQNRTGCEVRKNSDLRVREISAAMPPEYPLSLPLLHALASGRADVQDIDCRGVFLDLVDDPVDIRLLAVQQMPRGAVFRSNRGAIRVGLEAEDGLCHPVKPSRRLRRSFRF